MNDSVYKKLGKNAAIFAVGTFGSKAISFFLLPVFTRVLTQADYGKIDIVTTSLSLLIPIITFNVSEAVFRFTLDNETIEQKKVVLTSAIVIETIGFVFFLFFIPILNCFNISGSLLSVFMILLFTDIIWGISKIFIRAEQKLKLFVASDIIYTTTFATVGIVLVAIAKIGVIGYLISNVIAATVSTVVIFIFGSVGRYIDVLSVNKLEIVKLLKYGLPLILNGLGWWIISASDRYLLTYFLGFDSAGIYAVAHKFPLLLTVFSGIFYRAWQISSIEQYHEETTARDQFYSNTFRFNYSLMFLLLAIIAIFVKPFISFLVGNEFSDSWKFVPLLLIGAVFQSFSSIFGVGYLASKKTRGAMTTTLWGSAANIVVNVTLIPSIGVQAASLSTAIAFILMWILRVFQTRRYFFIKINWINFIASAIISCFSIILILFMERPFLFQLGLLLTLLLVQRTVYKSLANRLLKSFKRPIIP